MEALDVEIINDKKVGYMDIGKNSIVKLLS
jgi:hypothetical protein